uniref:Uncharacterized protein n=1 Tax=Romanomermis culicivorax TaxID=13658 RepID=A0A915HY53_ROMCU
MKVLQDMLQYPAFHFKNLSFQSKSTNCFHYSRYFTKTGEKSKFSSLESNLQALRNKFFSSSMRNRPLRPRYDFFHMCRGYHRCTCSASGVGAKAIGCGEKWWKEEENLHRNM